MPDDSSYRDSYDIDPLNPEGAKPDSQTKGVWRVEELAGSKENSLPPLFTPEVSHSRISSRTYERMSDTLRLYAGWLLAWYFLIFALGSYQYSERFPFRWGLLDDLFHSSVILLFAFAAFLFLLFTHIHRLQGKGIGNGLFLTAVWVVLILLYRANI